MMCVSLRGVNVQKNLPRVEREGRGSYLCEEAGTTAPESDPDNLANLDLDFTGRVILPHTPTHTHTHRGDELANYYLPFLSLSPLLFLSGYPF